MLNLLRKIVYTAGFRPPLGAVLHSPTLNVTYGFKDAKVLEGLSLYGGMQSDEKRDEPGFPSMTMYERMKYCTFCGGALEPLMMDIKECVRSCGRGYSDVNAERRHIIVFERVED